MKSDLHKYILTKRQKMKKIKGKEVSVSKWKYIYRFITLFEYTSEFIKLKICTWGTENNRNISIFKRRM